MKIGILVHPFWYLHSYEDNLQTYVDSIDKFDYVYVLLPLLNRHNRDMLIENYRNDFIDALLDKNLVNDAYYLYNNDTVRFFVKLIAQFRTVLSELNNRKVSIQELKKTLKNMDIDKFKNTFARYYSGVIDGDMCYAKRVKKACKDFKYKCKGKNVKFLYGGGVTTSIAEMSRYNLDVDNEYFIYGEYYNLCVESIKTGIENNHGIKVTKIPELSIYLRETKDNELPTEEAMKFLQYIKLI